MTGKKIQRIQFPVFEKAEVASEPKSLNTLAELKLNIVAELGRTGITLRDFLALREGDTIKLLKPAGDMADIYLNNRRLGQGEILVVNGLFSVRLALPQQQNFTREEET
ncbi:MAG: FliM/FliN family flagellar motor switch protein [Bacillota bacterium]|jgi:flagellar motor switch protein FliN/FliY|nr:FliM/FliN family flagellar motor switch protein [Clostridia bacterium]